MKPYYSKKIHLGVELRMMGMEVVYRSCCFGRYMSPIGPEEELLKDNITRDLSKVTCGSCLKSKKFKEASGSQ